MADDSGFEGLSMMELYRMECDTQIAAMNKDAMRLEHAQPPLPVVQALMRAAHSLKGAARMVGVDAGVRIAHRLEDFLTDLKRIPAMTRHHVDTLMAGIDLLAMTAKMEEGSLPEKWEELHGEDEKRFLQMLSGEVEQPVVVPEVRKEEPQPFPPPSPPLAQPVDSSTKAASAAAHGEKQYLRLSAASLDRLTGATGEALAISQRLGVVISDASRLRREFASLRQRIVSSEHGLAKGSLHGLEAPVLQVEEKLGSYLDQLDKLETELSRLLAGAYEDGRSCRMIPFGEALKGIPRLVHSVARQLGKEVHFVAEGERCQVDREVLEKLESPLGHLVRNAIDHGLETPAERSRNGKASAGTIGVSAFHRSGMLVVRVWDDGTGLNYKRIREVVVERGLAISETAERLGNDELAEFLFLPGFSLAGKVTDVSGRGAGLDVVMLAVRELGGRILTTSEQGAGTSFEMVLPLSLSVIQLLLFRSNGILYGLPVSRTSGVEMVSEEKIESTGGRQHVMLGEKRASLVLLNQILGTPRQGKKGDLIPLVLLQEGASIYGLVTDKIETMAPAAMRPLDPRLGKIPDVACVGILADGRVAIVLDQEDLLRSVHRIVHSGSVDSVHHEQGGNVSAAVVRKRVLVVDDSLTVRELERKMLASRGYTVEVAVDGIEAWNALRSRDFDLLVTDIDMPRLDGFGLVERVRQDPRLKRLPTMIVSYKDREEDRLRGLEVGADHYLTKGSFHDERLIDAVITLIGKAME